MKLFGTILEEDLRANSQLKTLPAETVMMQSNSYIRSIPVVLSGSMRVMREDEDGREILLYYIKPGESCIMSFLAGIHEDTSKVKLVVEEDSEVLMLPIAKASEWIKVYPEWADFIFKLYHKRFEELLEVINAVAFQKLDDRIVSLLKRKANVYGSNEFSITHQQLAEELGTTREVVSRLLKQMEKQELITLSRNKISLNIPL
ncbi:MULTISPECIES: Crp/Fnr family transcriptional regulator [Mucilaginibacter]|jgi:CRP/FNR family transcriptional regulator|uniref:Crp/Fnr family transcriptional regulator n=2 Tax=Mucilaginibacter TaxID=423349 RepID=A0A3E2NPY4_9SPHI|nr:MULTISPECIES: Crp/Fnr family transcriptional regulator [Mucilaginibacter]MBB3971185.1 CRP/FNR family transcriptional regulator [Mucilaginibacter phyllosphaerae]MDO3643448.1 Crp/Fnr family transcriptional regulator [Mucilaginibacter sp. L3T2-6]MDV6215899.1 Crp/Fnr family transcriptional regulator [Mucilaginibacter sp. L3T2-6]RFZ83052.1 Crp/Fnr family transcriptional regulator [Mucilaginibacter terrenus]TEW66906.1 Crp/Fnr family transcriptional regulator [Mucilaginibacter phyllosphaerae]